MSSVESDQARFASAVLQNPIAQAVLKVMPKLGLKEWYFTAGGVFQTVWNVELGRDPQAGIKDYDIFYFDDSDLSYEAEDLVIRKAQSLFADVDADIELRNEARVHLWYEEKFGVPAKPFTSCEDAIDHFASTTCCYGLTIKPDGALHVYAPHGYDNLFNMVLKPNPVLAPQAVYEAKAKRWTKEWPSLNVEPWPSV